LGQTSFAVGATPATGVTLATLEAAVDKEIAALLDKGVTAEELRRAQTRMIAANIYARDALGTGPRFYGAQLAIGRTMDEIERWPQDVQKVTVDQVNRAARAIFKPDRAVTSSLLPEKGMGG
jgi:zinc protease